MDNCSHGSTFDRSLRAILRETDLRRSPILSQTPLSVECRPGKLIPRTAEMAVEGFH